MPVEFRTLLIIGLGLLVCMGMWVNANMIINQMNDTDTALSLCEDDCAKWKNHSMVLKATITFIPEINDSVYLDDISSGIGRTAYLEHGEFNTSKYEIWCNNGYVWYVTVDNTGDVVEIMRVTGATAIKNHLSIT